MSNKSRKNISGGHILGIAGGITAFVILLLASAVPMMAVQYKKGEKIL